MVTGVPPLCEFDSDDGSAYDDDEDDGGSSTDSEVEFRGRLPWKRISRPCVSLIWTMAVRTIMTRMMEAAVRTAKWNSEVGNHGNGHPPLCEFDSDDGIADDDDGGSSTDSEVEFRGRLPW